MGAARGGGKQLFAVAGHGVTLVDMFMYIAMIPMYYEMVRMAVALFRRLKESQK